MAQESAEKSRVWHEGKPPHVGWWNSYYKSKTERLARTDRRALPVWRWWDGVDWSEAARTDYSYHSPSTVGGGWKFVPQLVNEGDHIVWSDYWPEGARVPRIDPRIAAKQQALHFDRVRNTAREMYANGSDDDIEVDDNAEVRPNDEGGYWVQAWVYVREDDLA